MRRAVTCPTVSLQAGDLRCAGLPHHHAATYSDGGVDVLVPGAAKIPIQVSAHFLNVHHGTLVLGRVIYLAGAR